MTTWNGRLACAAALAMLCTTAARANERSKGDRTVPVTRTGRIPLDLQVGPILFQELLVQGVPSDPQAVTARPPEESFPLAVVAVATHRGDDEASMEMTVTFLDAQGAPVITCAGSADQDEQTSGETHGLCRRVTGKMAEWARVAQVKFEARVEED